MKLLTAYAESKFKMGSRGTGSIITELLQHRRIMLQPRESYVIGDSIVSEDSPLGLLVALQSQRKRRFVVHNRIPGLCAIYGPLQREIGMILKMLTDVGRINDGLYSKLSEGTTVAYTG